jgi:hypothetical protein
LVYHVTCGHTRVNLGVRRCGLTGKQFIWYVGDLGLALAGTRVATASRLWSIAALQRAFAAHPSPCIRGARPTTVKTGLNSSVVALSSTGTCFCLLAHVVWRILYRLWTKHSASTVVSPNKRFNPTYAASGFVWLLSRRSRGIRGLTWALGSVNVSSSLQSDEVAKTALWLSGVSIISAPLTALFWSIPMLRGPFASTGFNCASLAACFGLWGPIRLQTHANWRAGVISLVAVVLWAVLTVIFINYF